jgi:hypothetical protein
MSSLESSLRVIVALSFFALVVAFIVAILIGCPVAVMGQSYGSGVAIVGDPGGGVSHYGRPPEGGGVETLQPTGTNASDSNTSCDATTHTTLDEGVAAHDDVFCTADNNNIDWSTMLTFDTPSGALDTTAGIQGIDLWVRMFDEGQSGEPTIRVDVYDGTACADLHETGGETTITAAGYPAEVNLTWSASGVSGEADICFNVVCTKSGGSPGQRNSCDIDAIEWEVTYL